MPFIPDTERVILFDVANRNNDYMSADELAAVRDCGVNTVLPHALDWDKFEKAPGAYNWAYLDNVLERLNGFRILLPLWEHHTRCLPAEWYSCTRNGSVPERAGKPEWILSPWNEDAQDHILEVLYMVKRQYQSDSCQIVSINGRAGESVMPNDARHFDQAAVRAWKMAGLPHAMPDENLPGAKEWIKAAYTKMIVNQQRILTDTPWREAWFFFHMPKSGRINCGVDWFEDYIHAIRMDGKSTNVNHVTFTYFADYRGLPETIQRLKLQRHVIEWVGAEYCQGLRLGNAEKARALGFRGVVCAPTHALQGNGVLQPWMLDELRKAAS
jgi:hypothetical protein